MRVLELVDVNDHPSDTDDVAPASGVTVTPIVKADWPSSPPRSARNICSRGLAQPAPPSPLIQIKAGPLPTVIMIAKRERAMPITDIVVVCAIISAFVIFAVALAWGDYQTRDIARASRERAAGSVNVVPLRQNAAPANAVRATREKANASA